MAMVALSEDRDCRLSRLMEPMWEKKARVRPRKASGFSDELLRWTVPWREVSRPFPCQPLPAPSQAAALLGYHFLSIFCVSMSNTVAFRRIL